MHECFPSSAVCTRGAVGDHRGGNDRRSIDVYNSVVCSGTHSPVPDVLHNCTTVQLSLLHILYGIPSACTFLPIFMPSLFFVLRGSVDGRTIGLGSERTK